MGEPESPTIGIRAYGLKGCLILLKTKSCQNCVLTIPLCRGGRDEATVENRVEIGRRTPPHAPSRAGEETAHPHRRAPRVTRVFFTRMGWPDPNTSWPDPRSRPGWVWRHPDIIMTLVYIVSTQSSYMSVSSQHAMSSSRHQTRRHCGTHLPRHQTWAELSWAEPSWAEPSHELREKILCSGVYVQPDLRLNLGRSSGQNCFDQILAVWNAIWTISDLFPANLIVPDAMVRSDHWDLRLKMAVVN